MAKTRSSRSLADRLTSRRGAWISFSISVLIMVLLFGAFGSAKAPALSAQAPDSSESAQTAELLKKFPNADTQSVIVVASRLDETALTGADLKTLDELVSTLNETRASQNTDGGVNGPVVSEDGEAAVIITPIVVGETNTDTAQTVKELRAEISNFTGTDLSLLVTGGPAFGADVAASFEGADFTLLLVTILIVAVLLIATYRSPVLWLLPLAVVALADGLAGRMTAAAAAQWNLQFDSGIISVLVFGAGTNYALLLISRYREELQTHEDHRKALATAWRHTAPAILASNVTVVLALLTLVLAVIPGTNGLGLASAIGLAIALASVLFMLPPLLAMCGRKVFWPVVPRPSNTKSSAGVWRKIAESVVARPVISLTAALALLAIMATGLLGTAVGLNQVDKFRVQSESAEGLVVLSGHFPPGEAQPVFIVTNSEASEAVVDAANSVEGVVRAHPAGETTDGELTKVMVTSEYAPSTPESLQQVTELRAAVHDIPGARAVVGGAVATDLDARAGNTLDFWVVAPLVLAVSFLVLVMLLRAVVAPVLLLLVNVASATAAIGAGAWLSRVLFGQQALDLQVPILAFLFLVALGIDYTIFLVHRARSEAKIHGTRVGIVEAVTHTGGVITSAGIVLAAVFAALGVLPLVTLGQLGLIVGLGVVVDTLVVRTVIVPAIFALVGDRMWWPGNPAKNQRELEHEPRERAAVTRHRR